MSYSVEFTKSAAKDIQLLPNAARQAIQSALIELSKAPFEMRGVKKLVGEEGYRLRVGDYRVLYHIDSGKLAILVVKAAHRRHVHRR